MERKEDILKTKYFKVHTVTDLKDLLFQSAKRYNKRTAFKLKNKEGKIYDVSYLKFKDDVVSFGTSLINLGLKDKTISLIGKNGYSWITAYFACAITGVVAPIDKELHAHDMINFINISESDAVIADEKYIKNILENKSMLKKDIIFINIDNTSLENTLNFNKLIDDGSQKIQDGNNDFNDIQINPDDMHILLFTSGTTGNAKGICLSHKNICSNVMSVAQIVKVDKTTSLLSILPVHHTYECTLGHVLPLYGGGRISYCDGLRYISKNINEYKPSFVICVPLLLKNMQRKIVKALKESLPEKYFNNEKHFMDNMPAILRFFVKKKIKKSLGGNVRTFIVGAAAIDPKIIEFFFKLGFKALQGYGLTECSPLVAGNNDIFYKADSVGLPIPDVEYRINNPDSEGNGEIIVKGPNVMLGYYKDAESTDNVLKKGWFYTGDLGRIDDDGFLYITGRCKSVIVTENGKNIYPEEIEYHLDQNPLIAECIVIGSHKEGDKTLSVNAKILPNIDEFKKYLGKDDINKDEIEKEIKNIVAAVNNKLPNYKHIKNYKILEEPLEKTTTQKIKRFGNNLSM
ncbi:MAG: AMP-binding protein [Clostridia bacterium]|nr:AMP-binding protein [Clostridia bacterium]